MQIKKSSTVFLVLFVVIGGVFTLHHFAPRLRPDPKTEIAKAFSAHADGPVDAKLFGTIAESISVGIEFDSQLKNPKFQTLADIAEFRTLVREYRTCGRSFAPKYPDLATAIEHFLSDQLGTRSAKLTAETRTKAVQAFHDLGQMAMDYR